MSESDANPRLVWKPDAPATALLLDRGQVERVEPNSEHATDAVSITLTTLWSGLFQIAGSGDWYPVDGFVTTTSTAGPVEIVAFDVHLVPNQG